MTQVAKSGIKGDGKNFIIRILQQLHCGLNPALGEVFDNTQSDLFFKSAADIALADVRPGGQLIERDRALIVFVEITAGVEQPCGRWSGGGETGNGHFVGCLLIGKLKLMKPVRKAVQARLDMTDLLTPETTAEEFAQHLLSL